MFNVYGNCARIYAVMTVNNKLGVLVYDVVLFCDMYGPPSIQSKVLSSCFWYMSE
jgi:hypothetical protein